LFFLGLVGAGFAQKEKQSDYLHLYSVRASSHTYTGCTCGCFPVAAAITGRINKKVLCYTCLFVSSLGFHPPPFLLNKQQGMLGICLISCHQLRLKKYLNIIRILHLQVGLADPEVLEMFEVKSALIGFGKEQGSAPRRMKPITPDILLSIRQLLDFSKLEDISFWSACLIGFFGLLRKSNLFHPSIKGFDPKKHFSHTCLHVAEWGFTLCLPWTKNYSKA
jgi:hypothetical protein